MDSKEAEEIKKATGLDLEGYEHSISNMGVRHAQIKHGDPELEDFRGQVAISEQDIEMIPYITRHYDSVILSPEKSEGRPILIYKKRIGEEYVYLEIVLGKNKKKLRFKDLWKKK